MRRAILLPLSVVAVLAPVSFAPVSAKKPAPTCDGQTATIVGTKGDDALNGTPGNDVIVGLQGADTINGGLGDDVICGNQGGDLLQGQGGTDRLFGQQGNDTLDGGEGGCCNVATNTGDDILSGGQGRDILHTSDFPSAVPASELHGDQGRDQLFVWSGGKAFGGSGGDTIRQFSGNSELSGGNGNDDILDWNDPLNETVTMLGGNGRDKLASEDATSTSSMDGGRGSDSCAGGDTTTNCES